VLRRSGLVEEIQERIVDSIDEKLRSSRIGLSSVGLEIWYNVKTNICSIIKKEVTLPWTRYRSHYSTLGNQAL
jgi:hypothetical protein